MTIPGIRSGPSRRALTLGLIVGIGVVLRVHALLFYPFWVDEAESAINGLTIIERGVPTDEYLELPIFENVLVQPWPESDEYEFRDISYSDRGVSIYHGWLPLYSIAAAQWIAGVEPATVASHPGPQHDIDELQHRRTVPRIPSFLFSLTFVFVAFWAGRSLGGSAVGWTAMTIACVTQRCVHLGIQARYYSLTLLLLTATIWAVWNVLQKGRRRDDLVFALLTIALFHTHVLSSVIACAMFTLVHARHAWRRRSCGLCSRRLCSRRLCSRRQRSSRSRAWLSSLARTLGAGAVIGAGTLPWVAATGFLESSQLAPRVLELVQFPVDLGNYVGPRWATLALFAIGFGLVWFSRVLPAAVSTRASAIFDAQREATIFLATWAVLVYLAFCSLIPAASYFPLRLTLLLAPPLILLASIFLAGIGHLLFQSNRPRFALGVAIIYLGVTGRIQIPLDWQSSTLEMEALAAELDQVEWSPKTRVYASPNDHLRLQYMLGVQAQSIAPIRKEFLEAYTGPIVYVAATVFGVDPADVDPNLDPTLARRVWEQPIRENLESEGWTVRSGSSGAVDEGALWAHRERLREIRRSIELSARELPILRGAPIRTKREWWTRFFYRFVEPNQRSGVHSNYWRRMQAGTVTLVPPAFVIHQSPPLSADPTTPPGNEPKR